MRVLLINPNTRRETTAMMAELARRYGPAHWEWLTLTAEQGESLIADPHALATAAEAVAGMHAQITALNVDAVIVAAFGDPGLEALRTTLAVPVVGIGEAAMRAADALAQPFALITITPQLRESTLAQLRRYGCESHLRALLVAEGDARTTAQNPQHLVERVQACMRQAIDEQGAQVLVIGGGPVAAAAQQLGRSAGVRTILPLQAAVERVEALLAGSARP